MGRSVDKRAVHEWTHSEDLTATKAAVSGLLFRPDLVVLQGPHKHFLVYWLPGVVEHRRDAKRAADFGAFPGNYDQRGRRLLITKDGHAERISSGDGGQFRVFISLCLRFLRLLLHTFGLYLLRFGLSLGLCRLCVGVCRPVLSCFRSCLRNFGPSLCL